MGRHRAPCRKCKVVRYRSVIFKSASTGQFVTTKEYIANPAYTYRQDVLCKKVIKCQKHGGTHAAS